MSKDSILVIGAAGQIGTELTQALREAHGNSNVVAADVREPEFGVKESGPFENLDVLDTKQLAEVCSNHGIPVIYPLAALLSASAEKDPVFGWELNMGGLLNVLDLAVERKISKIFWPSSIAVFGPGTPRQKTPQSTVTDPGTVYGITKLAGERWVEYYWQKHGLDIRSLRYPGLISYGTPPGGGTTDYAVDIFHKAINRADFTCFLKEDCRIPMMYMPDAIRGTLQLMDAEKSSVKIRSSYNFAAISFTPAEIADAIKKHYPDFKVAYRPDFRQKIADTWPESIDDTPAREDWGWAHRYDLDAMTSDMLANLQVFKSAGL